MAVEMEIGADLLPSALRRPCVHVCSPVAQRPMNSIEMLAQSDDSGRNAGTEWRHGQFMAADRFSINSKIPNVAMPTARVHPTSKTNLNQTK